MGKKDNKFNPYGVTGPFRILMKDGRLFTGEIKGAWDDAFLLESIKNGSSIIFIDCIAAMMEGIEPPTESKEGGNQ